MIFFFTRCHFQIITIKTCDIFTDRFTQCERRKQNVRKRMPMQTDYSVQYALDIFSIRYSPLSDVQAIKMCLKRKREIYLLVSVWREIRRREIYVLLVWL